MSGLSASARLLYRAATSGGLTQNGVAGSLALGRVASRTPCSCCSGYNCRCGTSCQRCASTLTTPTTMFREEKSTETTAAKQTRSFSAAGQAELLSRRSWACLKKDAPLEPWTHNPGPLGAGEVDIKVTHNGLCHTDIHMRDDDWGVSKFPFIAGHEVVGEVVSVGSGVSRLAPGMRVGVGWISNSCRRCLACLRGEENVCEKGYTGLIVNGAHGGFQEVCRAPADFVYTIPDNLDSASAAPLLCAGVTVFAPLRKHLTRPGMRVAILGVGGLGHLALQFANKMGGEVTALDISADKEREAKSLGAHSFATWGSATGADGLQGTFDLIINCAAAAIPTAKLLSLLKNDGTVVQIGIPGGNAQMTVPLQDLVFGQKKVAGSIVGGRADMQEMLDFAGAQGVKPMLELVPISKVNEAFKRVAEGKARYRIVLTSDWE